MSGQWRGHPAQAFIMAGGNESEQRYFLVTMLQSRHELPQIEYFPTSFRSLFVESGTDIATESAEFSDRWRVMCPNLRYAHAMTHPRMMERLLSSPKDETPVTIEGSTIFTWAPIWRSLRRDVRRSFDLLADVLALVPDHVIKAYGDRAASKGGTPPAGVLTTGRRDKNLIGRISIYIALTWILAPVAFFVGYWAIRAVRRGEANNLTTAKVGIALGYLMTGFLALSLPMLIRAL